MFHRKPPRQPPRSEPAGDWRSFDEVAGTYERTRRPVHEPPARDLVAAVAPSPGQGVLDVGTGTGVALVAARKAVGRDGTAVGIDASMGMLRVAREQGLPVVAAEAIDLPFRDATFDAVVAAFVIFLFTRYQTALFDMLRVLRPGGRLGVTTWGPGEDEFRRTWREVAETFVGPEVLRGAIDQAAPWMERFSDAARLEEALRDAGLRPVRVDRRDYRTTTSIEDYLAGRETSAAGRFIRSSLGEELWQRFSRRVEEEFRRRFPDPLGDTFDVLIAVGTKPE